MKQFFIITLTFTVPMFVQAHFGSFLKKGKNKTEDRVDATLNKSIDQLTDKPGEGADNTASQGNEIAVTKHGKIKN